MITVTFTADTLFQGSIRANGSTLSVTEADARVLVDIGVATASGLSPQGGWPQGEFGTMSLVDDAPSNGSEYVRKNAAWAVATGGGGGSTTYASIEDTLGASIDNEALSPKMIPYIIGLPGYRPMHGMNVTSISGSSTGVDNRGWTRSHYIGTASTTARSTIVSAPYSTAGQVQHMGSAADAWKINFSKKCAFWGLIMNGVSTSGGNAFIGNTNNFTRVNLGGRANAAASGDITTKGIGIYLAGGGSSEVYLTVHNGTTRTDVASGFTPASQSIFHHFVFSDGSGNVYLYINGVLRCSTNQGPTGQTANYQCSFEEQIESSSSGLRYQIQFAGDGVYIEQ